MTLTITPLRQFVLERVQGGYLRIARNGALEPSIDGFCAPKNDAEKEWRTSGYSEGNLLRAVYSLHKAGLIRFTQQGLHGVYKGPAQLTDDGKAALAALQAADAVTAKAAAGRVREFLDLYARVPGVDLARAAIIQKVDGQYFELSTADLVALVDAVDKEK